MARKETIYFESADLKVTNVSQDVKKAPDMIKIYNIGKLRKKINSCYRELVKNIKFNDKSVLGDKHGSAFLVVKPEFIQDCEFLLKEI